MIILYGLFISFYKMFLKTKDDTPIFASVCMVSLTIIVWLFFILIVVIKLNDSRLFFDSLAKCIYIIIHLALILVLHYFFNKERVMKIRLAFEAKTRQKKRIWYFSTLLSFVCPMISIGFLLKK
jgi:hypothetical protein